MPRSLSKRCNLVAQSEIRAMSIESDKVEGINMSQGICDIPAPSLVCAEAQKAIIAGENSYTRYDGIQELRKAIARKMQDYNGVTADPDTDIIVSGGSTGAFYCACLALLDPGDEVILFEPSYGYHVSTLKAVEAIPAFVRLCEPAWTFVPEDLERATNSRTKGIMVNTPANPSGKVFTREELEWIASFAARHDLFVFTDEIYEYIVYDGRQHLSPAGLPGMAERTITISGFSKTFSITGWRIGYSVSDKRWAQMIGFMSDLVYVCAPSPLQWGVARGLAALGPEYYEKIRQELHAKRERFCGALRHAGLTPYVPQGAYYVLADIAKLPGRTGKEKAMWLLREKGVACVPGEAFFSQPEDGASIGRFCFAIQDGDLEDACRRIESL